MAALQPPFRAGDMDNLYKRVVKGTYDQIPSIYSYDLDILISSCLQVSSKIRLSCDQLLALPCVKKWVEIVDSQFYPNPNYLMNNNLTLGAQKGSP